MFVDFCESKQRGLGYSEDQRLGDTLLRLIAIVMFFKHSICDRPREQRINQLAQIPVRRVRGRNRGLFELLNRWL